MLQVSMRRLQVFVTVVDAQGFGAAAVALDIAQSSVSAHIRAVEERLGAPVFQRQPGRPPRLTEAGQTLYNYAVSALAGAQSVSSALQLLNRPLHFAAQRFVASWLLGKPLEAFATRFPQVELIAHTGTFEEVRDLFQRGTVDLAFLLSQDEVPGLPTRLLGRYRLAFIAPPDHVLANQTQIDPAVLAQHPFISAYRSSYFGRTLWQLMTDAGLPTPPVRSQAQDMGMVREMVLAGLGISLSLRRSIAKDLQDGRLVELDVALPPMHLQLRCAVSQRAKRPEVEALVELLRQAEGQVGL
jgi:DNA-binding transcriptional LysR family regulator